MKPTPAPPRLNTLPARHPLTPHPSQSRSLLRLASLSVDLVPHKSSMPLHPNSLLHPYYLSHLLLSRSHHRPPATTRTTFPLPPHITSESSRPLSLLLKSPPRHISTQLFTLRTLRSPPNQSPASSRAMQTSPLATYDPSLWVSSAPSTPAMRDTESRSTTLKTKSLASSKNIISSLLIWTASSPVLSRTTVEYLSSSSPSTTISNFPLHTSAPSTPLIIRKLPASLANWVWMNRSMLKKS